MAVAVLSIPASMTAEQYHRITGHLDASGTGPPPGRRFHACFGDGDHLMVFDVWDSPEDLDAFTTTLMPILAIEHIDMAPPEPLEIHDLVDDGDSDALRKRIAELRDKAFFIRPIEKLRDKLHSVTGKPTENQDLTKHPAAHDDSPSDIGPRAPPCRYASSSPVSRTSFGRTQLCCRCSTHFAGYPSHRLAERSGVIAGVSNGFDPAVSDRLVERYVRSSSTGCRRPFMRSRRLLRRRRPMGRLTVIEPRAAVPCRCDGLIETDMEQLRFRSGGGGLIIRSAGGRLGGGGWHGGRARSTTSARGP